jgi:Rrf2 family nitric oxide-sensitive transcriptional repressor
MLGHGSRRWNQAGGGIRLTRPSETITLGEVVRLLEARHAIVECFRADGGDCVLTPRCRLKSRLALAAQAFITELDRTTLAECAYT